MSGAKNIQQTSKALRKIRGPEIRRIACVDMGPLNLLETGPGEQDALWLRGGFPDSYLAENDAVNLALRGDFIGTYLERT